MKTLRFLLAAARGILLDQSIRRRMMFFLTLANVLLLFIGAIPLWPILAAHPFVFAIYWLACGTLAIGAAIMAICDIARTVEDGRNEQRRVRRDVFGRKR